MSKEKIDLANDELEKIQTNETEIVLSLFKKELEGKLSKIKHYDKLYYVKSLEIADNLKYTNTYVLETEQLFPKNEGLEYKYLIKILESYGIKRSRNQNANHLFGIINDKFYNTKFYLMNNFDNINSFDNKYYFYFNLKYHFQDYYQSNYPNTFILDSNTSWNYIKNKIYIARPINGCGGKGIINIYSPETLEQAKDMLLTKIGSKGISLTEYATNPLLIKGRKLHLRAYLLITLINNTFKTYLLDYGRIMTALKPYKKSDWGNKDIHDSHHKSSYEKDLMFPDDLYGNTTPHIGHAEFKIIFNNIRNDIKYISEIAASEIFNFNNAKNTFEVFGIDVFVRDDLSVFIIEINSRFVNYYQQKDILYQKYFEWIDDCVIKPCLFPHLKVKQTPATTPIYENKILDY